MLSVPTQLLALAGRIAVLHGAGPDEPLSVRFQRGSVTVRFDFTAAELEPYLPPPSDPQDELTSDDRSILRVLAGADRPLLGKDIAEGLGVRREWSALRERLSPKMPLRRLGFVSHEGGEGYAATESGRTLVASF